MTTFDSAAYQARQDRMAALRNTIFQAAAEFAGEIFSTEFIDSLSPEDVIAAGLGLAATHGETPGLDGEQVARFFFTAMAHGLEDSNWHTECSQVARWIGRMDQGENLAQIIGA